MTKKSTCQSLFLQLPVAAPRNPFARPARLRHAGAHGIGTGARRQQMQRDTRREVQQARAATVPDSP